MTVPVQNKIAKLSNAVVAGQVADAVDIARALAAEGQAGALSNRIVAHLLYANGKADSAVPLLRRMTQFQPNDPSAHFLLAHHARLFGVERQAAGHEAAGVAAAREGLDKRMANFLAGDKPIIVGPWLSEPEFELLYWLPFLFHLQQRYGLPKERLVAISRGGASDWYAGIAGRTWDLVGTFGEDGTRELQVKRQEEVTYALQGTVTLVDAAIVEACSAELGLEDPMVLHPAIMFDLLHLYWTGFMSLEAATGFLAPYPAGWAGPAPEQAGTVAASFYARSYFDTEGSYNANLPLSVAGTLAEAGVAATDLSPLYPATGTLLDLGQPPTVEGDGSGNLADFTRRVAASKGFVGTYGAGGFLAMALGKPAVMVVDTMAPMLAAHTLLADALLGGANGPSLSVHAGGDWDGIKAALDKLAKAG